MQTRITLDQWRCFVAVVDCGGYAQAAETLNKSQSTVSYAVNKLQTVLGLEVLELEGRRAVLTDAGEVMYRNARQLLEEAVALEGLVRPLSSDWEPELNIVIDEAMPLEIVLTAFERFGPQSRGTRVHYHEAILSGSEEALTEGEADLVVSYRVPPGRSGDLLYTTEFIAVAAPEHPLSRVRQPLTPRQLQKHTHIVIRDSARRGGADAGWLRSRQRWTVSSIQTSVQMVSRGLGFAWLPRHAVASRLGSGELVALALEQGGMRRADLFLVYGHAGHIGPATKTFAELLVACATENSSGES